MAFTNDCISSGKVMPPSSKSQLRLWVYGGISLNTSDRMAFKVFSKDKRITASICGVKLNGIDVAIQTLRGLCRAISSWSCLLIQDGKGLGVGS